MKFAEFFRAAAAVVVADVTKVFDTARAAVAAVPLPDNIRTDLNQLINDAQADLLGAESFVGTLAGQVIANGIDDMTTLLLNTANALAGAKSPAEFSDAEKTVFLKTWTAMRSQGDTLAAQFIAGIDPSKPKPAQPQS